MKRSGKERLIKQSTMGIGLFKGLVCSIGITAGGAALMASLILRGTLHETAIGYTAMTVLLLASFAGSKIAAKTMGKQLAVTALATAGMYFLVLLALNILLYKGGFEGIGVTVLLIFAGAGVTILTGMNQKERRRKIRV